MAKFDEEKFGDLLEAWGRDWNNGIGENAYDALSDYVKSFGNRLIIEFDDSEALKAREDDLKHEIEANEKLRNKNAELSAELANSIDSNERFLKRFEAENVVKATQEEVEEYHLDESLSPDLLMKALLKNFTNSVADSLEIKRLLTAFIKGYTVKEKLYLVTLPGGYFNAMLAKRADDPKYIGLFHEDYDFDYDPLIYELTQPEIESCSPKYMVFAVEVEE